MNTKSLEYTVDVMELMKVFNIYYNNIDIASMSLIENYTQYLLQIYDQFIIRLIY